MRAALRDAVDAGLSSEEARARLAQFGPNVLAEPPRPSHVGRFAANLVHLFALLLWGGAGLALLGGLPELAIAIVVVILVNAVFAFVQEYRAKRASEARASARGVSPSSPCSPPLPELCKTGKQPVDLVLGVVVDDPRSDRAVFET